MQSRKNASNSKFPAIKSRQTIRVAGEYWLPLQRLVDLGGEGRGRDILDEIGAYQTEGSNWNIAGSRDPGPCLVLGFVGNGALGAKPGTETLDCASSPIHYPWHPPAPPPLDPANFQQSSVLLPLSFLPSSPSSISNPSPQPRYYIAGKSLSTCRGVQVSLSFSLSLSVLETKFKLDTANNGAPMGKYDSVISYSLCRNRLRRTIYRPRWIMDLEEWV